MNSLFEQDHLDTVGNKDRDESSLTSCPHNIYVNNSNLILGHKAFFLKFLLDQSPFFEATGTLCFELQNVWRNHRILKYFLINGIKFEKISTVWAYARSGHIVLFVEFLGFLYENNTF